ncbi:hydroxymethylpyrimidine/phosphomethylpyrimidine kinase [Flavobacterium psychrophilum]|uniref:hydroxymethylpyrimidine kinase n=2 Tax=Flavobacterium psychrophilum TaxID=96345 RepID=A0A1Z5HKW5_FLAPS|nr:hydroxymethylpyrimidine/phosphomethylpyrimidine kinase [Flavobacterium psychrophilum]AIN73327.1 phosphomethylpyrimidine kinase [Flavobacterium psychrophilum FPG3]EKT2069679.1 hydroxymethylpyrimidine/phosphomethylpyrimidine kinase [Flavobacterium psychrophilum]EKT2071939.1 hydroxymethylpyrimidine/phosphomethylpyrimidine kinase [Flavobacterium psychrophilum]EKT3957774.1 hydroxymethylpyrimidine/phosphomethylpyrimidine kinase [Flavobacterium psychrophilum]EKT3962916.1 hydroxymethylpyrimidine/ph
MPANRPFVLTIAGFDPSAGAGVLADIKTFEQHRVYGFAINTANTIQTENVFFEMNWTNLDFVSKSLEKLFENYPIKAVKIGIVPTLDYLSHIVFKIKKLSPKTKVVWDTVLKSSTEFNFLNIENQDFLIKILKEIDLITPNYQEVLKLSANLIDANSIATKLSEYCAVLLKGGHNLNKIGFDYLYLDHKSLTLQPNVTTQIFEKHGSGCVLSSAITANLALGQDLKTACINAKKYIETYLQSTPTKLGNHYV